MKATKEPFRSSSDSNIDYYWIVSEKRKPMMLEQLRNRGKLQETNVTWVPGIFNDDVEATGHPNLPKEWLRDPVMRLLAAHMKALRLFKNKGQKEAVLVCMEDDVVLHKDFEEIVKDCASYISEKQPHIPTRVAIGYLSKPMHITKLHELSANSTISRLNKKTGDPWGTQGYMMNYTYVEKALKHYEDTYKTGDTKEAADVFMFDIPDTEHLIVEPPACIEDNPTFGTMLGHTWNADLYKQMIATYNRSYYYFFEG
jgi:hypothetical protein